MSVSSDFSPIIKLLTQSDYANSQQIEQALTQFQQSGQNLAAHSNSFIEIIESITGRNLPKHIKQNLLLCLNFPSEEDQELVNLTEARVIDEFSSEQPDELELVLSSTDNSEMIGLVNKILAKALIDGISHIHIEPLQESVRIRFRKDGVLYQAFDLLPKKISSAIVSRFKIMANLNISERRISQSGKFQRNFQGNSVEFQVSTLVSRYGEKIVLQIIDNGQNQLNLADLITNQETLSTVKKLAKLSSGLILVTGSNPGRLTTLYAILAELNNPEVNIVTAEDSMNYALAGITQVYVTQEKGKDFASVLRSLIVQDPDILFVGEMPDQETATLVFEAARRGCLVLIGVQANDTASAITDLAKMGVEPYQIINNLKGIISQCSMRRVCKCCISYTPSNAELARFGLPQSLAATNTFYQAKILEREELAEAKQQDLICKRCKGIGYKGTIGIYEVLPISNRIQTLIMEGAAYDQIKDAAVAEGMTTLLTYSLNLVQQGYTTLDEVERVVLII